MADSDCCSGFTCSKNAGVQQGFCLSGPQTTQGTDTRGVSIFI